MHVLREFMIAPELSSGTFSVWVEASRRLPGRNPDAIRKKYVDMCDKNGWRRPGDAAIPVRVLPLDTVGNSSEATLSQRYERRSPRAKRSDEWDDAKKAEADGRQFTRGKVGDCGGQVDQAIEQSGQAG